MRISDWSSDVCSSDLIVLTHTRSVGSLGVTTMANITGTTSSESLTGTASSDVISALAGSDTISALDGADLIYGNQGSDSIIAAAGSDTRSEEHTSELQSLMRISYAVFCLKKKQHITHQKVYYHTQGKH